MWNIDVGELLTRGTVWLALTLYVAGEMARRRSSSYGVARWLNTFGCVAFIAHVACAFHFYHDWSHSAAFADTARQTSEMFGWDSGAGLYINYFFAAVWIADVFWDWMKPGPYILSAGITWTIRAFFWCMIFNGAVVFAHGALRGYGVLLSVALIACWWPKRKSAH